MPEKQTVCLHTEKPVKISKWKVEEGTIVYDGRIILLYEESQSGKIGKLKSKNVGTVVKLCVKEGEAVSPGTALFEIDVGCSHPTVINDLCAECGADLQKDGQTEAKATIPMVHSIPQLKVSHEQAQKLGRADTERLLKEKKLVLLVDLDQTLIHTTHDNIPNNLKDVHHFQLLGGGWYHTRLRPGTKRFLSNMSDLFELHICTFGVRPYAHTVAHILDRDASLFSNRILSRDECFDFYSKHANLQALFPCGDELVCIIDDREDVWNYSPNVIPVKPYHFFKNTGDINDPNLPPAHITAAPNSPHGFFAKGVRLKTQAEKKKEDEDKTIDESNTKEEQGDAKENEEDMPIKNKSKEESGKKILKKKVKFEDTVKGGEQDEMEIEKEVKKKGENGSKEEGKGTEMDDKALEQEVQEWLDIEDEDDYLHYLEDILKRVHSKFYKVYEKRCEGEATVKWVIGSLRSDVLRGCRVAFSGIVPMGEDPRASEAGVLALKMGATLSDDPTENDVTHLVAASNSTAKVHAARKRPALHIVNPNWLLTTAHRWEKVDEHLFPVGAKESVPFNSRARGSGKGEEAEAILSRKVMFAMQEEAALLETDSEQENDSEKSESEETAECDGYGDDSRGPDDDDEFDGDEWSMMATRIERGMDNSDGGSVDEETDDIF